MDTPERLSTLTAQYRERQGLSDAMRFLALLADNRGSARHAAEAFVNRWPRTPGAETVRKDLDGELFTKAIPPAGTTDPAWAGALAAPAILDPLLRTVQQALVLTRAGCVRVPARLPVPYEASGPTFQWVSENAPKPVSALSLGSLMLNLFKAASIQVYSKDLMRASAAGVERVLLTRLVREARLFADRQVLDPAIAATAGRNPASLTNAGTSVTPGADVDGSLAALAAAFFAANPDAMAPTYLASPAMLGRISGSGHHPDAKAPDGILLGHPLVVTPGAGTAIILFDASATYYHDQITVSTSDQAMVEMEAAPSGPTATTVQRSLWEFNESAIAAEWWADYQAEPSSVFYTVPA